MGCIQSLFHSLHENEDNLCVICYSAFSNVVLIPCGHYQICNICAIHFGRMVPRKTVILSQETNNYFKYIRCPICFQNSGLIKIFSNRKEAKCKICQTKEINGLILPCSNFTMCFDCCLDFASNQSDENQSDENQNRIYFSTIFSVICPICRSEGAMIKLDH